jgi:hypothetical protein
LDGGPENSVAFSLIDDLMMSRRLSQDDGHEIKVSPDCDILRGDGGTRPRLTLLGWQARFSKLFEAHTYMQEREKNLLKRARLLNNEVLKEKISLQEAKLQESEEQVGQSQCHTPRRGYSKEPILGVSLLAGKTRGVGGRARADATEL